MTLVEKLVRTHTNLVLRESLDDVLHHLLPWDMELIIDDPVVETDLLFLMRVETRVWT